MSCMQAAAQENRRRSCQLCGLSTAGFPKPGRVNTIFVQPFFECACTSAARFHSAGKVPERCNEWVRMSALILLESSLICAAQQPGAGKYPRWKKTLKVLHSAHDRCLLVARSRFLIHRAVLYHRPASLSVVSELCHILGKTDNSWLSQTLMRQDPTTRPSRGLPIGTPASCATQFTGDAWQGQNLKALCRSLSQH